MKRMPVKFLFALGLSLVATAAAPPEAAAQYRPMSTSGSGGTGAVKGENYHVEFAANLWSPGPDFVFRSEGLGIPGTEIDLDADLGLSQKQMYELRLVLRPSRRTKFRFHYMPMKYTGDTVLSKDIIFNGILFPIRIPVQTDFTWKAYRGTFEYDVLYHERGYLGFLLEAKYADTVLKLNSPISNEFVEARAPIPAIGAAGRFYVLPFLSITGEFTYFRLPDSVAQKEDVSLNTFDYDIYGTVNIGNNFGIQAGYRSMDMAFSIDLDSGSVKLKAPYFGGVIRF
jgi:hypothetical protein